jgi:toxin ParE1/3/4
MYSIEASPAFKITLNRLLAFLERKYSVELAKHTKTSIKSKVKTTLSHQPLSAPISPRLLELGIAEYRQLVIDDHNIVFYKVDKALKIVTLLAVMDARQSIEKLLFEVMLMA